MSINILDSSTAMKIAAGEVIDRPASAVRELLDNALDAGADWISIDVDKGGREYLSVQDNGKGMTTDDLQKCYLNHATSKINQFDDLSYLKTFGFRGEALASLAEISHLKISSRTSEMEFGAEIEVLFGEVQPLQPKGMNQGTQISLTEFFQNVPARLKFLSSDSSEYRAIVQELLKKALAKPEVSFELSHNGEKKYQLPSSPELFTRIVDIFPELSEVLQPFIYEESGIKVYGFLSKPTWYKATRNYQYFFVNGRMIEWQAFKQQIAIIYQQVLPPSRFPAVFCYVEIDTQKIDFNVHPQKREIRFDEEKIVADVVRRALRQGLMQTTSTADRQSNTTTNIPHRGLPHSSPSSSSFSNPSNPSVKMPSFRGGATLSAPSTEQMQVLFQKNEDSKIDLLQARYIGTMFHTYLIFEEGDNLHLADFHAMHERLRYEKILQRQQTSQQIIPMVFQSSKEEAELFESIEPKLTELGFVLHPIGEASFSVEAIPNILDISKVESVLRELFVEDLSINDSYHWDSICKMIACKGSSRAGDTLSVDEVRNLLQEWSKCEYPHSCPHGRPIVITMNKGYFDKEFKRTGV